MIEVTINGERHLLAGPTPLRDVVENAAEQATTEGIAVGINRRVVARRDWGEVHVQEGDEVEIIAPFAGG